MNDCRMTSVFFKDQKFAQIFWKISSFCNRIVSRGNQWRNH